MRCAIAILTLLVACAVSSSPPLDHAEVTRGVASELAGVDRAVDDPANADVDRGVDALAGGGAQLQLSDDDACRLLDGCIPFAHHTCCKTTDTSRCCGEMFPGPDRDEFICSCSPLPHTDPGHGIPQDPFAP